MRTFTRLRHMLSGSRHDVGSLATWPRYGCEFVCSALFVISDTHFGLRHWGDEEKKTCN